MASVDEFLDGLVAWLGLPGFLVGLFLVFAIDAAIFPLLPEVAIVLASSARPVGFEPVGWAFLLLGAAVAGEAAGNSALYLVVRRALVDRGRMPRFVERAMRRWVDFLLVRDERVILLNRVAPIVPMVGAFIATCRWDFRRSFAYIVVGATAKYAVLLTLTGALGMAYDPVTARWVSVALVLVIVGLSLLASVVYRRRAGVGKPPPA